MVIARYILVGVLSVACAVTGVMGAPGRVICYGADGHFAIEGPAEAAACRSDGGFSIAAQGAAAATRDVLAAGCTDVSIPDGARLTQTHHTQSFKPSFVHLANVDAVGNLDDLDLPFRDSCAPTHPPRLAELCGLRVIVLLI